MRVNLLVCTLWWVVGVIVGSTGTRTQLDSFRRCLLENGLNPNSLVETHSPSYEYYNYQWQLRGEHKTPGAYLVVESELDVVGGVRCGQETNIHLVPKGGGHSFEKYSFGYSTSVVVDTRKLTSLAIDQSGMTARVGSGWLAGPLAWSLWEGGNAFTGFGNCPTVGVTGHATGGGLSMYHRQIGLSADNILQANIVTANAQLLTLNSTLNSDLFWAIRGGVASNFGILTEITFKIHQAPPRVFQGTLNFQLSQFVQVFDAWQHHVQTAPNAVTSNLVIGQGRIMLGVTDLDGTVANFDLIASEFPPSATRRDETFTFPEFLFYAARNFSSTTLVDGIKFDEPSDLENVDRESEIERYEQRKSFYAQNILNLEELEALHELVVEVSNHIGIAFESYGGAINNLEVSETGFVHRGNTLYSSFAVHRETITNGNGNETELKKKMEEGSSWLETYFNGTKRIVGHVESYQNYVDGNLPDYLERYYGSNLPRLITIKQTYDPFNHFHLGQSITPTSNKQQQQQHYS